MFRNSIFPFKINNLDIVKHKVVDLKWISFSIYDTSQTTFYRRTHNSPKYLLFLIW